ncbi:hypothetical protein MTX78_02285 [Hymenobacter tibetensis]|uniref:PH domain-containing protein n=1 Tax=Hymenobacter tibetensis TaxID=497967 RepID=A0ABY4D080_9BACT|nr:hypothetical protein [Hymenobacter tibetensis]UOG75432.1 hypothetical protein MTX78_02285 [Hymenobacter tibetensis]
MKTVALLRPLLEFGAVVVALIVGLRLITGLFGTRRKTYQISFSRQVALLFWPLLCLAVGLPFLASFLFVGTLSAYELILLLIISALVLGFAAPALVLHLHYYLRNHATQVVFEPKQNVLEVFEDGQRVPFTRADIQRVVYARCVSPRLFWSNYEYVQLYLHDGRIVSITSLLLKLTSLTDFLRNTKLETTRRWFCFVRP